MMKGFSDPVKAVQPHQPIVVKSELLDAQRADVFDLFRKIVRGRTVWKHRAQDDRDFVAEPLYIGIEVEPYSLRVGSVAQDDYLGADARDLLEVDSKLPADGGGGCSCWGSAQVAFYSTGEVDEGKARSQVGEDVRDLGDKGGHRGAAGIEIRDEFAVGECQELLA